MNKNIFIPIIIMLLCVFAVLCFLPQTDIFQDYRTYTIQDIHHWCCNNINSTISPTGDNCSNVINNIYGGVC